MKINWVILAAAIFAGGCVAYRPAPLDAPKTFGEIHARTLSDPAVLKLAERESVTGPAWTLEELTKVALLFHSDMEVARAHIGAIEAGETTAGQSPNPSIGFVPQIASNAGAVNPWTIGATFDIPIETAGKREIRLAQAKSLSAAARHELAEAAWKVRSRVRDALLELSFAKTEARDLKREADDREHYTNILETRLKAGEASRPDVDMARLDLLSARYSYHAAESRTREANAKLAAALGMTTGGLARAEFESVEMLSADAMRDLDLSGLQREALLNRLDIHRALTEYAAAEKALELEIAKQYPDLHIGPGYQFDQGQHKWELGISLELPILNQNGGPIAEAEGKRKELAAKFGAIQAQAIADLDLALTQWDSAIEEADDANAEVETFTKQLKAAEKSLAAGEVDRSALLSAQIQRDVASRLWLDAARKASAARSAIEDAVQAPLETLKQKKSPGTSPASAPATTQSTEKP